MATWCGASIGWSTSQIRAKNRAGLRAEVTPEHEIVWEYISPYWRKTPLNLNLVYRAYRAPYSWVPQLPRPREAPIARLDVKTFRVPGAAASGSERVVELAGLAALHGDGALCVPAEDQGPIRLSVGG